MPITYQTQYSTDFSITIGIGAENRLITLTAADLDQVATQGLHFALPEGSTVELGSLNDLIVWLNQQLQAAGVTMRIPAASDTNWPAPIQSIYSGILSTTVTVQAFSIDQDPKNADGDYPPLRFELSVTGTATQPVELIPNFFSVVGGGIALRRSVTPS